MKNLPEKIYLNFDFEPDQSDDFKDMVEVTHSCERIFKNDVEYIRKDVAEQMAKELVLKFIEFCAEEQMDKNGLQTFNTEYGRFLTGQSK